MATLNIVVSSTDFEMTVSVLKVYRSAENSMEIPTLF